MGADIHAVMQAQGHAWYSVMIGAPAHPPHGVATRQDFAPVGGAGQLDIVAATPVPDSGAWELMPEQTNAVVSEAWRHACRVHEDRGTSSRKTNRTSVLSWKIRYSGKSVKLSKAALSASRESRTRNMVLGLNSTSDSPAIRDTA